MQTTQPALWFSRHPMTADQLAEATSLGFHIIPGAEQLGARNLNTDEDLWSIKDELAKLIRDTKAGAVFGVFPTPLLPTLVNTEVTHRGVEEDHGGTFGVPAYAAWNVQRSTEGGKPTFAHKRWVRVGRFCVAESPKNWD